MRWLRVGLAGQRRASGHCLLLCRTGFAGQRVVKADQKQIEPGHQKDSAFAEGHWSMQLQRDLTVAGFGHPPLQRTDSVYLPPRRKLRVVQSLWMVAVQLARSHLVGMMLRQMDWRCFVFDRQCWLDRMLASMLGQRQIEKPGQMLTDRKQASDPSEMVGQSRCFVLEQRVGQTQRRCHRPLLMVAQIQSSELAAKAGRMLIHHYHHQRQKPDRSLAVRACQRRMLDRTWIGLLADRTLACRKQSLAGPCRKADRNRMLQGRQPQQEHQTYSAAGQVEHLNPYSPCRDGWGVGPCHR